MKNLLAFITFLCISVSLFSQSTPYLNTIVTGVPFLRIESSTQRMGMANIGVVANKHNYQSALTQNPSLMMRDSRIMDFHLNYVSWLNEIADGINIFDFGGMYSLNDRHAVGVYLKYFDLGNVTFTDFNGEPIDSTDINELSFSASYAMKLGNHFSLGTALRYIRSDLGAKAYSEMEDFHTVNSIAADFGVNYFNSFNLSSKLSFDFNLGLAVTNLGPKISYTNILMKDNLPTNLAIGTAFSFDYDATQHLNFLLTTAYQSDKLLVPTPCNCDEDNNDIPDYREYSVLKGMLVSFSDAPQGRTEEFWEINHKVGFELRSSYKKKIALAVRGGYFYEHPSKGNRQFYTIGTTVSLFGLYLDASKILKADQDEIFPLENTFSLGIGYQKKLLQ